MPKRRELKKGPWHNTKEFFHFDIEFSRFIDKKTEKTGKLTLIAAIGEEVPFK